MATFYKNQLNTPMFGVPKSGSVRGLPHGAGLKTIAEKVLE